MNRFYKKTGRIASLLLAAALLLALLCGCSAPAQLPDASEAPVQNAAPAPSEEAATRFTPGSYTASAPGNNGNVTVTVTVSAETIDAVTVDSSSETAGLGDSAMNTLIDRILSGQTLAVDTISGATNSSNALLAAVKDCLTQAGADLDALQTPIEAEAAPLENVETDVLVIGGGGAGVVAAYNAAANGARVLLVEKQGALGGNTALAKGIFGCSASSFPKAQGATETTEDHLQSYLAQYPKGDPDMLRVLAENGGKAADFLMENGGEFAALSGPYTLVPKTSVGGMVISIYQEKMQEVGVDCRLETAGTALLTDEAGAVTGATVTTKSGSYDIHAKAVVLTTGGFAANNEIVTKYNPVYEGIDFICTPGDTGDGHVMAEAVGAELAYMDVMKANPFIVRDGSKHTMIGTYVNPGIVVSRAGVRLGNEHANYGFAPSVLALPEKEAVLICNDAVKDKLEAPEALTGPFETIDALAEAFGIDAEALRTTLSEFAQYAWEGSDPFGRTVFADDLSSGPYYAALLNPAMQGTFGGVKINTSCEALRADGTVLAGLYAAGECAGDGLSGANPVPTDCVFGRIAGESAAAFALK